MIGYLRGTLIAKRAPLLLLDVSGVGYEVEVPMSTFFSLPATGTEVKLYTHLQVRDDAHNLFGFGAEAERALFRSLIRVNGVGAKLALMILSSVGGPEFHRAIRAADSAALIRIPGIGKKTAERLIVELRDRLPEAEAVTGGIAAAAMAGEVQEALDAMLALGFKLQEANRLLRSVATEGKSSEEIIRLTLQSAGRS